MISKTAGYVCSKHYASLKRLKSTQEHWLKAYKEIEELFEPTQKRLFSIKKHPIFAELAFQANELFLPGDHNHLLIRKFFIRKWIMDHLHDHSIDTICVVGSGYDPILYTLNDLPKKVILIDHPDMLSIQQNIYSNLGQSINVEFKSLDLLNAHDLIRFDTLCSSLQSTLFITEGLIDYLNPISNYQIIMSIMQTIRSNNNKWISTLFCLPEMKRLYRCSFKMAIKWVGEQIKWEYRLDDFKQLLFKIDGKINVHIFDVDTLNNELPEKFKVNENKMNAFYLMRCW